MVSPVKQNLADLFSVRKRVDGLSQRSQIIRVAFSRVSIQLQCGQKADIALMSHKILGDFTLLKGFPQNGVDLVVKPVVFGSFRNVVDLAHGRKSPDGNFLEIE